MAGLKRYVLIVGLVVLLPGTARSAQGLGGGWQEHTGAVGMRGVALEGGGALIQGHTGATTDDFNLTPEDVRAAQVAAVDEEADLVVTKTDDPDPVIAGEPLTYTLTVSNSGPVTATTVLVTDALPSGVSFDGHDPSQGTYNSVTGVWTVGEVADGGSATLALFVTVDPSRRGTLFNVAEVSADEADPTPGNNTYTQTTVVSAEADLAIVKTDDPDPVVAGEPLTYTLTITNNGPSDATGVVVTDTLPAGVSFDDYTSSQGTYNSVTGVWTVGSLAGGGSATLTLVVTVDPATRGTLSNSAEVAAEEFDPNTANNDATESTDVDAQADLTIVKTDDPDPVVAGETLTYTLTVTNGGPSDATGVVVTDTLPLSVTLDAHAPSQGTFNDVTGVWTVGAVADGGSATLMLFVTVDPSKRGSLRNEAEVSADETDPNPVYNEDEEVTTVIAEADLAVAKTYDPDPVAAGETLTYTLVVTNSGPSDATGIIVTDHLPDEVTDPSWTPSQGTCFESEPGTICNVGPLASGANASVSLLVSVTSPLTNGTIITNVVTVSGDQTDPYTITNNSAQAQTTVQSSPLLTITKRDHSDPVHAGENVIYTLDITNDGNENATGVTVTEHYDPNVSFDWSYPPPADSEDRVWTWSTLAVGDPKTIFLSVQVTDTLPAGTVLTNQATLDSDQTTPVTVTELTTVTSAPKLTLTKISWPTHTVQAGGTLGYVITYQNSGDAGAEGVTITETYDSRVTYVSAYPPPDSGDNVWYIGRVRADDPPKNIVVMVEVDTPLTNGTVLTNVVTMDSQEPSHQPHTVTLTTTVASAPVLALNVTDYPDPVRAGDPLTYTLRYSNTGNADATQAVITATLDVSTTFSSAEPPPTPGSGRVRYWDVGTIAGKDAQDHHGDGEIVIYAGVPVSLPNKTPLEFTAELGYAEGDVLTRTVWTTVRSLPDLVIRPVGDGHAPSLFSPNKEMTYTVASTMAGTMQAGGPTPTRMMAPCRPSPQVTRSPSRSGTRTHRRSARPSSTRPSPSPGGEAWRRMTIPTTTRPPSASVCPIWLSTI